MLSSVLRNSILELCCMWFSERHS